MTSPSIERLRAHFASDPGLAVAVYVFGSEARGTARAGSDVDVAVLFGRRPARALMAQPFALADDLSGLLGRPVDLVVLDTAPPDLVHRVLRDGVLILDRDRSRRIAFEVAARNAYFDLLPILERYRRRAAERQLTEHPSLTKHRDVIGLDDQADDDAAATWILEIERRSAEVATGAAASISFDDYRAHMRARRETPRRR